jgi:predicted component of type VI protein secretion system
MELDSATDEFGISFYLSISADLCPAGALDIKFLKLKDFHPDALVQNNSFLCHLLDAKNYLTDTETKNLSAQEKIQGLK